MKRSWLGLGLICVWLGCGVPGGKQVPGPHEDGDATVTARQRLAPLAAGPVSELRTYHQLHTATLLPSGKELVTGGEHDIAEEYDPATGTWKLTGSMSKGRQLATATLLRSGKVLVTGDFLDPNGTTTAEVYDPATRTWSMTGPLNTERFFFTATLLPSGRVLVVGRGEPEEYDPDTNTWRLMRAMAMERSDHTATLLPSGHVLVAGGAAWGATLASAEVYDPVTLTWRTVAPLTQARSRHTATLLPSGQVLVAGGDPDSLFPGVELYDPVTGTWLTAAPLAVEHGQHTATLLPSGHVLMVQGLRGEVYVPPATNTWSPVAMPALLHRGHTATLLPSGQVLVAAGEGTARAEVYDPATDTWRETGALAHTRSGHTATLLSSGKVLATGGGTARAEVYEPATRTWQETGAMKTSRSGHTATPLPSGRVLVVSGADAEEYDPSTGTWSETGALKTSRAGHAATPLPSGKVLVAGGGTASVEVYDPAGRTWSTTTEMSRARAHHTATLLPSGLVLVVGGRADAVGPLSSAEVYDPATGIWRATGAMTHARSGHTATLQPSGKVLVAGGVTGGLGTEEYDPATGLWSETIPLPDARSGHTATLLPTGEVLVVGGTSTLNAFHAARYTNPRVLPAWRPAVDALSVKRPGVAFQLTGRGFQGLSEASGGGMTQSSATNFPGVSLLALEGGTLLRIPGSGFSDTAVTVSLPAMRDGDYLLSVMANGITGGRVLRVDGTAPASPVVKTPGSGAWLNTSRPTFSGTAEPGSPVRLTLSGGPAWTLTADARGDWSHTPDTALAEGPSSVSATALDEAGNESPPSAALGFTVDTRAPEAPEVLAPTEGSAFYTTRKPDIMGRAEPDSTVLLRVDEGEPVTLKADGVGFWRFTPTQPLALGRHGILATATDRAGNTSAPGTSTFVLSTPGSYYGWSCATSPGLPLLWAWVLVAFWLMRPARGAGGPHRR
ncbi:MAG TPA: kelch repeat-containing protein [Archangium sp.]|nr:kelch repeat-containing protein [Archangium sp.]